MPVDCAVSVEQVVHRYGSREALRGVTFQVGRGEIFGLLGPNGGGKTSLFRILATSFPPTAGRARIFGIDVAERPADVRRHIGVVFQAPSLDKKLSASENLMHHGHIYGLRGTELKKRIREMLERVQMYDRAADRVEQLSGGMQRRVEVAKGLLHHPQLMIMDEPSSGLDPGARRDLWTHLADVRQREQLTILLTTHLMDEAAQCDRVAILNRGEIVALGTPSDLAAEVGEEIVSLEARDPSGLVDRIRARFGVTAEVLDNTIRIERAGGHELVAQLFDAFPGEIQAVTVRRPSLEDVFIRKTGHRFWDNGESYVAN
jgi:ABC-2 type transport system ATP-binding protein